MILYHTGLQGLRPGGRRAGGDRAHGSGAPETPAESPPPGLEASLLQAAPEIVYMRCVVYCLFRLFACLYTIMYVLFKQRPTRQWHRGEGVLEPSGSVLCCENTRVLTCRGVLRTHCPSFVALRGFADLARPRPRAPCGQLRTFKTCVPKISGSRFEVYDCFALATMPLGTACRFQIRPGSRSRWKLPETSPGNRPQHEMSRRAWLHGRPCAPCLPSHILPSVVK